MKNPFTLVREVCKAVARNTEQVNRLESAMANTTLVKVRVSPAPKTGYIRPRAPWQDALADLVHKGESHG